MCQGEATTEYIYCDSKREHLLHCAAATAEKRSIQVIVTTRVPSDESHTHL